MRKRSYLGRRKHSAYVTLTPICYLPGSPEARMLALKRLPGLRSYSLTGGGLRAGECEGWTTVVRVTGRAGLDCHVRVSAAGIHYRTRTGPFTTSIGELHIGGPNVAPVRFVGWGYLQLRNAVPFRFEVKVATRGCSPEDRG